MHILIAGATGFIGSHLVPSLPQENKITVIGRNKERIIKQFGYRVQAHDWTELDALKAADFDVIINLCGRNISSSRWTPAIKQDIIDSRVQSNTRLLDWIMQQNSRPRYYCANAVGIYGLQKTEDTQAFDENSIIDYEHPRDFLSEVGIRWEESLKPGLDFGLPITTTRFGVVLKKDGGMLKKLYPSFRLGLGSIIGDGKQMISWVYMEDLLLAFRFLLMRHELLGPFNITSPHPVNQAEFATTFAKTLGKPLFLRTPGFIMRLMFGEMGDCLINQGNCVLPKRLEEEGFRFSFPELEDALKREFGKT